MLIENILDEHILFGFPSNCDIVTVLNFCVLFAKWYIYCKKLNNKNDFDLYEYQVQLKQRLLFEKMICNKNQNQHSFEKWNIIYEHL